MKTKLLILGAGGHGRVAADIAIRMDRWSEIYFLDDNDSIESSMGIRVVGSSSDIPNFAGDSEFFVAVGDNKTREKIFESISGFDLPCLVHPDAVIGKDVFVGEGSVVMPGAVVNCCARIGRGSIVNTSASVDHDCVIGDFVHISPGVSMGGGVLVGQRSWLGIGCSVSNNISITSDVIVGAGAVVVKDINEPGTYIGVPAGKV